MAERKQDHSELEGLGTPSIAIIGGGITGAVCARALVQRSSGSIPRVTVFDQGRGLGGRTSHRRISGDGAYVLPTAQEPAFAFDHGCQFFRADTARFRSELLEDWLKSNWAAEWKGSFCKLGADASSKESADFFGCPSKPPFYCGVGGMSSMASSLLADAASSGAIIKAGVRVANTSRLASGRWLLSGTSGKAAFHDTAEEEAARVAPDTLGEFDAVIVTDVSASAAGWHRASAGIPEEVASQVRNRTRVALFTALIAFEKPLDVKCSAFAAADDILWFAARSKSKPGLEDAAQFDCWTLVSTPKYAAGEIERVPMQDPVTGAFRPQEMSYLEEGPSAVLLSAFGRLLSENGEISSLPLPRAVYVGGQRWGSAFPAPANSGGRDASGRGDATVEVLSVAYDSASSLPLAPIADGDSIVNATNNFLADDLQKIYYASDYVSAGLPGVEGAALSGLDAADHILAKFCA